MKQRNGVWQSDFRLSNGDRIRVSLGTSDRAEAEWKEKVKHVDMEAALRGRAAPLHMPRNASVTASSVRKEAALGMAFKTAFKRAQREYEPWRSSTSPKTISDNYEHVVRHFKEDTDLGTLDRAAMLDYVEKLRDTEELSPSTINQRLSLVSVLLTLAEDWTKGQVAPFKMPRQKIRNGRIRVLSYAEEKAAVDWFLSDERTVPRDKDMADLIVFLTDTGFRLSEALNLESRDIDWENELVPAWVTKADLPRQVPMTQRASQLLQRRATLATPFGMLSKDYAEDRWAAMRVGLKINTTKDPEFVLHALRHTCASRLVASGMDAFRVQKWMGHKNIVTTQKYVTLFGSDLKDLAKALDTRHTEATHRQSVGHPNRVFGVPKLVPKTLDTRHSGMRLAGMSRRSPIQGPRKVAPIDSPVGVGLLIRRSLVRAQVGEPENIKTTDEVDTNLDCACVQGCAQK